MSDWILNLPVLWMSVVILAAIYVATAGIYLVVTKLAVQERARAFKAISPGMLPPLSVVFALLVGFLAAQVWSDADRAHTAVNREAGALRAMVILAGAFPGETESRLRDLVRGHIQDAVNDEWPAMSRHAATLTIIPPRLADSLKVVLSLNPSGAGQQTAQRELVQAIETALDACRQRIILGIFATGVGVAVVLIASHSRPFSGELAVSPTVLMQVMPEAGVPSR